MARSRRVSVDSDLIASVGYDNRTRALTVEFNSGDLYTYTNVPATVHADLMGAESHGRYFNANIRNNAAYGTALVSAGR